MYAPKPTESTIENLYYKAKAEGYTQKEIASEFDISKKAVYHYLRAKDREMPAGLWVNMCETFGLVKSNGFENGGDISTSSNLAYPMPLDNANRQERIVDKQEIEEAYSPGEIEVVRSIKNASGTLHNEIPRDGYIEYEPTSEYEGAGFYLVRLEHEGATEPVKLRRLSGKRWEIETHLRDEPYHLVRNQDGELVNEWGDVVAFEIVGRIQRYTKKSP